MESYKLQSNEVILFEGSISLKGNNDSHMLLLTNLNIVIETTIKKMFKKAETSLLIYPITDVKVYNGEPQIKQKFCDVSVFLESNELLLTFDSIFAARKFISKAVELVTGKTTSERGAEKVRSAIGLVDDTLGIDTMGTVSGIMKNGVVKSILGGTKGQKGSKPMSDNSTSTIKVVAEAATEVISAVSAKDDPDWKTDKKQETSYDDKISTIKKLKDLLDMGIISQEEFDTKKKDLLAL